MMPNQKNIMLRFSFIILVMVLIGIAIICKAGVIMFAERQYWKDVADRFVKENVTVRPTRGNIISSDGLLLAMDVVIEDRDGSQDHRQDNDDDAVAEDRLVRALAGIVVFVFGLVVTLIVLFHGANILYKYNKRRGNRCRFVSENRRTSPHVLQI